MPKPSNSNATHGTSHAAAMLNQDNLAQHTQHHQELDESRDFVREFLDTLDPFSAPLSEPGLEPVELMPDIVLRSPSTNSPQQQKQQQQRLNIRPAQQSLQHQQQSQQQNQPHKQNKHLLVPPSQQQYQPNTNVDKSKRKKVVKGQQEPQKRTMESRPIIPEDRKHPVDGTRLKEGSGADVKDDTRQSKKRKQQVDDVEQGVQGLEIRDPHSDHPSSREKRKRQTEGTATKPKAPTATKGKQAKSRLVQDDRHASNQQDEDRRKDPGRRAPLHDLADNQSDDGHDHHNQRRHRRHHLLPAHQQKSEVAVNNKPGKTYSNKPRKILTQSSLIMNQFVSPNVSRERITIPGKLDHLGIFKKGKASKKTTIQRDVGNEFSEDAFFNQRTDSRGSRVSGRRQEQVVTSAYFTDEKQDQDGHATSKSSSSYGNKSDHEQYSRVSIASSVNYADSKTDVKKRAIASTPHVDHDRRDRQGVLSYHSSTHSNQQQLSRTNTHRSTSTTTQVSSSQPLEDVVDSLLEINESGVQSPTQGTHVEYEQVQQAPAVEYIPATVSYSGPYTEPYPYGYAVTQQAPWQLEPYHSMPDPHEQQVYPVYEDPVPLAYPRVLDQRLQPIEYAVMNTDTEYDHDLPWNGHPPQPFPPPPAGPHFRWRPHRLF